MHKQSRPSQSQMSIITGCCPLLCRCRFCNCTEIQRKVFQDMCIRVELHPSVALLATDQVIHVVPFPASPSTTPATLPPTCSTAQLYLSYSVMSAGLASISNQLESANDLTNCEESQQLGTENSTGDQLRSLNVANSL